MLILTFLSGVLGALISKAAKLDKIHWIAVTLSALIPGLVWALIVRRKPDSLATMGVTFDIIYGGAYFITFVSLGEKVTTVNVIGAFLAITGLALLH